MSDENLTNEQDELAEETVEAVEEAVEPVAEQAVDAVADAATEVETASEEAVEEFDVQQEKVESAVRHVAEEAQAEVADEVEEAPAKRERRSKQKRAEKAAKAGADAFDAAPSAAPAAAPTGLAALGVPAWLGIAAASLVVGLLVGRFALGGESAASAAADAVALAGQTAVTEDHLDDAYATYVYKGDTHTITVREVLEQNGTIDAALDDEGNYTLPSAEYAINVARTNILNKEVEARDITVSDDDVAAYAEQALGTSDYEAIASAYGMEAEEVENLIVENCKLDVLRKEVIGGEMPEMPEAPTAPEEGAEDQQTKEYADYIIALVGDEWDSKAGAWADESSAYATALADSEFTADGASYNDAQTAYYVAYQKYSEAQNDMSVKWTDYLNGLLSNASIQVGTLIS